MANNSEEIIDLTESFILVNHCSLVNEIIVIDAEDSFEKSNVANENTSNKKQITGTKNSSKPLREENRISLTDTVNPLGICPICREGLEKGQMASTKCGHVYCIKCIEQSLRHEKKCPTCRTVLKGASSYHRLFLGI